MRDWSSLARRLSAAGIAIRNDATASPIGGGDISAAWRLSGEERDIFLKTGGVDSAGMFSAEAEGLQEIAKSRAIRVPEVLAVGQAGDTAFLALEWLSFDRPGADTERQLGERLAGMHRVTSSRFGWHRNNTIGLTPQHNPWTEDWATFFQRHRLGYQLELAAQNGFGGELQRKGKRLLDRLPALFDGYEPVPSLLHGDLWGGNWASSNREPVLFDPAVYYGDRETDLAMTKLFGGFGRGFYAAYENAWPLQPGSQERQHLYQLYHVLNHLNLFGGGYLGRALALIKALR